MSTGDGLWTYQHILIARHIETTSKKSATRITGVRTGKKCIGLIEAHGLAAAIQAADTAVKSSKVQLLGYEYSGHSGMIVVKIEGTAAAVKSAMDAAAIAVGNIPGSFSTINATVEKPPWTNPSTTR